jgi:hypothetical protein
LRDAPLRKAIARHAERHVDDLMALGEDVRRAGGDSLGTVADEINARSFLTARGGRWQEP